MKEPNTDRLRGVFQDMELNNLPQGFEDRLMQKIHQAALETKAKNAFRDKIYTALSIASGIAAIVFLPLIVFYFTGANIGFELPSVSFDYSILRFSKANIDPLFLLLPFVVLMLLIGDILIRKHVSEKHLHHKAE